MKFARESRQGFPVNLNDIVNLHLFRNHVNLNKCILGAQNHVSKGGNL